MFSVPSRMTEPWPGPPGPLGDKRFCLCKSHMEIQHQPQTTHFESSPESGARTECSHGGGEWGAEAHRIPPIKTRGHASDQSPGQMELSQNTVGRSTPPPPLLSLRLALGSQPVGAGIGRERQDVGL